MEIISYQTFKKKNKQYCKDIQVNMDTHGFKTSPGAIEVKEGISSKDLVFKQYSELSDVDIHIVVYNRIKGVWGFPYLRCYWKGDLKKCKQ